MSILVLTTIRIYIKLYINRQLVIIYQQSGRS
jgi:hypothetical protein